MRLQREDRHPAGRRSLAGSGRSATRAGRLWRLAQVLFFTKMNRSRVMDSYMSLDVAAAWADHVSMISRPYQLYVERTDPAKNMTRYYAMEIERTMFGEACLTRRWGRIGNPGQKKQHVFEREDEAVRMFLELLKQKRGPKTTHRDWGRGPHL